MLFRHLKSPLDHYSPSNKTKCSNLDGLYITAYLKLVGFNVYYTCINQILYDCSVAFTLILSMYTYLYKNVVGSFII